MIVNNVNNIGFGGFALGAMGMGSPFISLMIHKICANQFPFRDYVCLERSALLDGSSLYPLGRYLVAFTEEIANTTISALKSVQNVSVFPVPSFDRETKKKVDMLLKKIEKVRKWTLPNSEEMATLDEVHKKAFPCLNGFPIDVLDKIARAFAEEFVFRFLIQKVAFAVFSMAFPKSIAEKINHLSVRLTITSGIFAFLHVHDPITLPYFIGGLIDGAIFEKWGLIAATANHAFHNFVTTYASEFDYCQKFINQE